MGIIYKNVYVTICALTFLFYRQEFFHRSLFTIEIFFQLKTDTNIRGAYTLTYRLVIGEVRYKGGEYFNFRLDCESAR